MIFLYTKPYKLFFLFTITIILFNNITAQKRYFYTNKPYGSEALFNPITMIINGGYDITQLQSVSNNVYDHQYGRMFNTVMRNLGDPITAINNYGWGKLLRTEILPLSFEKGNMQYINSAFPGYLIVQTSPVKCSQTEHPDVLEIFSSELDAPFISTSPFSNIFKIRATEKKIIIIRERINIFSITVCKQF